MASETLPRTAAWQPALSPRKAIVPTPSAPRRLTGRRTVPGSQLQCSQIEAADDVDVDFDIDFVTADGLYALELITAGRVAWMGARAFRRREEGGVEIDDDGQGTWRSIDTANGLRDVRVAGCVLGVFRGGRRPPADLQQRFLSREVPTFEVVSAAEGEVVLWKTIGGQVIGKSPRLHVTSVEVAHG